MELGEWAGEEKKKKEKKEEEEKRGFERSTREGTYIEAGCFKHNVHDQLVHRGELSFLANDTFSHCLKILSEQAGTSGSIVLLE